MNDDPTIRGDLTDWEWRQIQTVVQSAYAVVAARLETSEESLDQLLQSEMEKNPLSPTLSERQRLSLWRYYRALLRYAYGVPDS